MSPGIIFLSTLKSVEDVGQLRGVFHFHSGGGNDVSCAMQSIFELSDT